MIFKNYIDNLTGGFDCCGGEQGGIYGKCPFPKWEGCETNSSTDSGSQLLVRWLQHGALSAVDRTHCGGCNREFWTFPNFDAMKNAMDLRNALFPYLYTENHRTRADGISLLHPLYYDAPTVAKSYSTPSEYFFGRSMIVQPIVAPIAVGQTGTSVSTWLPPGDWVAWSGEAEHSSSAAGTDVREEYSIHELPMFVRAGAVVPMRTHASLTQMVAFSDPLVWVVWPGSAADGNASVVEDDGATLRFESGAIATTAMTWSSSAGGATTTISVAPTEGDFGVDCSAEEGFEYGGSGADLQDVGVVADAAACCNACATYSNCAFWTWSKESEYTSDLHRNLIPRKLLTYCLRE